MLLVIFSVLCILVSAVRPSIIWSQVSHLDIQREEERLDVSASMGFKGNGRMTDVQWDGYSLIIKGQRIFIQ